MHSVKNDIKNATSQWQPICGYFSVVIMLVHTGNQQKRAGIHMQIIYNTGPIQEIQQANRGRGERRSACILLYRDLVN